jgi:hypothetical protein
LDTKAQIRIAQDCLEIEALTVADLPTVAYISTFEPDRRADAVKNCVQLGARVSQFASDRMGAAEISERIDASASAAKSLLSTISETTQKRIEQTVEGAFGTDGKSGAFHKHVDAQLDALQRELEAKLDPERATSITRKLRDAVKQDVAGILTEVRKELNLSDPRSPLGLLRKELDQKHKALDDKIGQLITQEAVKSAVGAERVRGTSKGTVFEDALHPVLDAISRPRHDHVERTGSDSGLMGKSRRGDFVIEINPQHAGGSGLRIVLEAKNDQTRLKDLLQELDEAKENRAAQFAIGISTNPSLLPPNSPPIVFPTEDKMIVHVPDYDPEDGTFDAVFIEVALDVARYLAIAMRAANPRGMDLVAIDTHVANAINVLTRFTEIKKRLTTIVSTARDTDVLVESIRAEVRNTLHAIRDAIADELNKPAPEEPGQSKVA